MLRRFSNGAQVANFRHQASLPGLKKPGAPHKTGTGKPISDAIMEHNKLKTDSTDYGWINQRNGKSDTIYRRASKDASGYRSITKEEFRGTHDDLSWNIF